MWMVDEALCVVIFFFKQKTAYEMRISDWSSDVCSSDLQALLGLHLRGPVDQGNEAALRGIGVGLQPGEAHREMPASDAVAIAGVEIQYRQIGRESCMDRVCQSVLISVVAVQFRKKQYR